MQRTGLHRWTLWLLPLLLVRAALPSGVMLSAIEGRLSLALCSGFSITGAASHTLSRGGTQHVHQLPEHGAFSPGNHADEAAHQNEPSLASDATEPAPCPYGLVTSGCEQVVPYASVAHEAEAFRAPSFDSNYYASPPSDPGRIRGPPSLS